MVNIRVKRGIGGIKVGSVISLKFAEIELTGIAVLVPVARLNGLTGVGPGVPLEAGSTETCPVRATGEMAPDIPYRTCGA